MKSVIFSLFLFQIVLAQPLSLKEFNNKLMPSLASAKALTDKEYKNIRIRLGAEIGAATSMSHKDGELQRLLIYMTLNAKLDKANQNLTIVKSQWEQYLALSNSSGQKFEPQYLWNIYKDTPYMWRETLENADYLIKNLPQTNSQFFFPLHALRCDALERLRAHDLLLACWAQLTAQASGRVPDLIQTLDRKVKYLYSNHTLWPDLLRMDQEIDQTKVTANAKTEFQDLEMTFAERKVLAKMGMGQLDGIEKEIEALKAKTRESETVNRLLVRYFIAKSRTPEASKAFRLMNETLQSGDKLFAYYDLGATVHIFKNEVPVAAHYLTKYVEAMGEVYPEQIPVFLAMIISRRLTNSTIDVPQLQEKVKLYEQILQSQAIKDPALEKSLLSLKEILRLLTGEIKEKAHVISAIGSLKGVFAPKSYMEFLIPKYLDHLESK